MGDGKGDGKRPTKSEWLAVMSLIAALDHDAYRALMKEAWNLIVVSLTSTKQN